MDRKPYRYLGKNPHDVALIYADQDVYEKTARKDRPKLGNTGRMSNLGTKVGRPGVNRSNGNPHRDRASRARAQVSKLIDNIGTSKPGTKKILELELLHSTAINCGCARNLVCKIQRALDRANAELALS